MNKGFKLRDWVVCVKDLSGYRPEVVGLPGFITSGLTEQAVLDKDGKPITVTGYRVQFVAGGDQVALPEELKLYKGKIK